MTHQRRPSIKELLNKIKQAKVALDTQEGLFAEPSKAVGELDALNLDDSGDVWPLIRSLLDEIKSEHYAGSRPPHRSYEDSILNEDLFAFAWESEKLNETMYLKFVLKDDQFYYVSLHKSRSNKKKGGS